MNLFQHFKVVSRLPFQYIHKHIQAIMVITVNDIYVFIVLYCNVILPGTDATSII